MLSTRHALWSVPKNLVRLKQDWEISSSSSNRLSEGHLPDERNEGADWSLIHHERKISHEKQRPITSNPGNLGVSTSMLAADQK